jgi:hypothetical protein
MQSTYKNIVVKKYLGPGITSFSQDIHVPFLVDEIVLTYINSYDSDGVGHSSKLLFMHSDLIDNNILFSIPRYHGAHSQTINTPIKLDYKRNIQGTYTFTFRNIVNALPSNHATFDLYLTFNILFKSAP